MDALDVIRRAYDAYAAGGVEALAPFYHPEAEIVGGPYLGPKRTYRDGPDGLRQIMANVDGQFEEFIPKPIAFRPGGSPDLVLVEGVVTYKTPKRLRSGAWRSWWVITVQDERIRRLQIFHEAAPALAAAGLEPEGS
jgi:ketosteroid isomerase-like protein